MSDSDPYRRLAGIYDFIVEPMQSGVRRVALEVASPLPSWRVLDVGCGTGTGMVPYLDTGCSVSGVDRSKAMLDRAKARLGDRADLHLSDGSSLPFSDEHFDLVTTSLVLHEVAERDRSSFLEEMARVAKPDGRVLVTDFRFGSMRGWKGPVMRSVSRLIERVSGHYASFLSFKAGGGVPGVLEAADLVLDREKIVAGGNLAVYVIHPAATAG
ncbi:MAG: class I SAM-dependent methyltransferase [Acidimicrobiia bacterium]